jgi:hypothetical protein
MRERAALAEGSLEVSSHPGGTTVSATFPVRRRGPSSDDGSRVTSSTG